MPNPETSTTNAGNNKQASQSTTFQDNGIYIYEMPVSIQQLLYNILDRSEIWEQLADHMGYEESEKNIFRSQVSPTRELFSWWGEQNHTVTELFMLLYRLQQHVAMNHMRDLVDHRYHRLILTAPDVNDAENPIDANDNNNNKLDLNRCASTIPQIKYTELTQATNNWSKDNELGKGGFGTVYRGNWKHLDVAIKLLEYRSSDPEMNRKEREQSINELRYLNSYRHENILQLYGYSVSDDGNSLCLVSQLMNGGTLDSRLRSNRSNQKPLNLLDRVDIASGTARGLVYLHQCDPPLIHGDIKTANILLDSYNQPKICDFGLSREGIMNASMEVSRIFGTKPYLPAEFIKNRKLTPKVDSYSFGVVLFEIATGQLAKVYDRKRDTYIMLTKYVRERIMMVTPDNLSYNQMLFGLMDGMLRCDERTLEHGIALVVLGLGCTREKASERHEMLHVFDQLKTLLKKLREVNQ